MSGRLDMATPSHTRGLDRQAGAVGGPDSRRMSAARVSPVAGTNQVAPERIGALPAPTRDTAPPWPARSDCPSTDSLYCLVCAAGGGEHSEGDMRVPCSVVADLVLVDPQPRFRGLEAVLDRPAPASYTGLSLVSSDSTILDSAST